MAMERKDELTRTLRERFADHEMAVPRGVWEAIRTRTAMAAVGTDPICGLLRERFADHEVAVDPASWGAIEQRVGQADPVNSLLRERFAGHEAAVPNSAWTAIEGQLGRGATIPGGSSVVGWAVGGAAALLLVGGLYLAADKHRAGPVAVKAPVVNPVPRSVVTAPVIADTPTANAGAPPGPKATVLTPAAAPQPARTVTLPAEPEGATTDGAATTAQEHMVSTDPAPAQVAGSDAPTSEAVAASVQVAQRTMEAVPDPAGRQVVEEVLHELSHGKDRTPEAARSPVEVLVPEPGPEAGGTAVPEPVLFIPNVFTPNGDGENEQWVPQGSQYQRVAVRIFSSTNGSMVYSANDLRPWDGNDLHGQPCPSGTYLYAVEVVDLAGRAKIFSNTVNIIR